MPETKTATTEAPARPRGRFREFLVTCRDEDSMRRAGHGMTLEMAIAAELKNFEDASRRDAENCGTSPEDFGDQWNDLVIWDGCRVAAVLLLRGDGPEVVTFERPAPGPIGPKPVVEVVRDEPEAEVKPEPRACSCATERPALKPGRPLARTVMTFESPSDPTALAEVEVIVTDEGSSDRTAWHEMPESRRLGWQTTSIGEMTVAVRAVVD